jgi:uncharacterized protein YneF (UPF0154 family)
MKWIVAVLSLTVLCLIFGTVGALFIGKPSMKLWQSDRQVVSLETKPSRTALTQ